MAGWSDVYHESVTLNNVRRLRRRARFTAARFWERAYGSFLISGGSPERRAYALAEKLLREMTNDFMPTVVLTSSEELETEMIARMNANAPGYLRITSPNYPNYHFFYGWNREEIFSFFSRAANILEFHNDADLSLYASAFLEIMERCHQTGLSSMSKLARYSDAEITRIGQNGGASEETLTRIEQYAKGGENFRLLLQQIRGFLSQLTTEQCDTRYNLSSCDLQYDAAYIVNLRSSNPALMYAYFAAELRRLLARTIGVRLAFSELPIARVGELRDVFLDYLSMTNETGLSISNVSGTLDTEDLKRFKAMILLLDSNFIDSNFDEATSLMGVYDQVIPTVGGGRQTPFSCCASSSYQVQWLPHQLRVRPQDLEGYEAALCGANGREIELVRHFL